MDFKKVLLFFLRVILGGVLLGLAISLFQYLVHLVNDGSLKLVRDSSDGLFAGAIIVSFVYFLGIVFLNRRVKGYAGSGIPQVEAYHDGWYSFNPLIL